MWPAEGFYVVDFIYFSLIDFPIFNVADIFVSVGTVLFVIYFVFIYDRQKVESVEDEQSN